MVFIVNVGAGICDGTILRYSVVTRHAGGMKNLIQAVTVRKQSASMRNRMKASISIELPKNKKLFVVLSYLKWYDSNESSATI